MVPMCGAGRDYQLAKQARKNDDDPLLEMIDRVVEGLTNGVSRKYIAKRLGVTIKEIKMIEHTLGI
jgi:hypothetical protein